MNNPTPAEAPISARSTVRAPLPSTPPARPILRWWEQTSLADLIRLSLVALVLVALALTAPNLRAADRPPTERPNLIIILTDDQGYHDVGFNGGTDIPTPHLDSIARQGVRFTNGYVTYTVCSPSRAGLLTGRYPQRFGHERNPRWAPHDPAIGLPRSERTLADVLGAAGYHCGLVGKWHLGAHPVFHPLQRGFHEFYGMVGGGKRYFPEDLILDEPSKAKHEGDSYRLKIERNGETVETTRYLTDEFSDEAVRFVDQNRDRPFFLFLAYNAPHSPLQAPEDYLARFDHIKNPRRRTYAAMVSAVDDGIGRVMTRLRELGLEQNTIVFFLSDNGGPTDDNASDNRPLRGKKGQPWEGGWRVPFALQWPGRIPRGRDFDHPISAMDIFATMAGLVGAQPDPERPLDGINLLPYLTDAQSGAPHEFIYLRMHDRGAYAVRSGDYKLVIPERDKAPLLYNLRSDPGESVDISPAFPQQLQRLEEARRQWDAQLIAPVFAPLQTGGGRPGSAKHN
jgi:arylsulfatase A-like enzyme